MPQSLRLLYEVELECALQGYDFELLPSHVKLVIGVVRDITEHEIPGLYVRLDSLSQVVQSLIPKLLEPGRMTTEDALSLLAKRWERYEKRHTPSAIRNT